jgi:hypothetical protein
LFQPGLDGIGDTHLPQHVDHDGAARAGGVADRSGRQQRILERFGGTDVGLRQAGAHADPVPVKVVVTLCPDAFSNCGTNSR